MSLEPAAEPTAEPSTPWSPEAFEDRYRRAADPWDFRSSPYEQDRYDRTVGALARSRYRSGFEPACSVGELTWRLSQRCDHLRAVDVSPTAVAAARELCGGLDGVEFAVGSVQDDASTGHDLVVFSELGYYFDVDELDAVVDRLTQSMEPGADLVACHWLGHSEDHRLHGSTVHERIARHPSLVARLHEDHDRFVLDAWTRR